MVTGMSKDRTAMDIPSNPHMRRAWILFRLRTKGITFAEIAQRMGVHRSAISLIAAGTPSYEIEAELARLVEVPHEDLFPEHYADGRRIPRRSKGKIAPTGKQVHSKSSEAA